MAGALMEPATTVRIIDLLLEMWNVGRTELAPVLYAADAVRLDPLLLTPLRGPVQIAELVREVRGAFRDFSLEITETHTDGARIISFWSCSGVHCGVFLGIAPGGQRVEMQGVSLLEIENQLIVEEQTWFDSIDLIEHLRAGLRTPPFSLPMAM